MRNWASYVTAAREHARLTRTQLAHAVDTSYATVWRWETGKQIPERADVVRRLAEATGVDLDEALAAAGMRPDTDAPEHPAQQEPPHDPDIQIVLDRLRDPSVTDDEKELIKGMLRHLAKTAQLMDQRDAANQE